MTGTPILSGFSEPNEARIKPERHQGAYKVEPIKHR